MNSNGQHSTSDHLDLYLDGMLAPDERRRFERDTLGLPAVRERLDQHRAIEASLHRLFVVPEEESLRAIVHRAVNGSGAAESPQARGAFAGLRWSIGRGQFALAASLLLALCGVAMIWMTLRTKTPAASPYDQPWRSVLAVYEHEQATGLTPDWVCETEEQFADSFWQQFRQRLVLAQLPADVEALGLSAANTITPRSMVLLARVDGEPVIVLIDWAASDTGQSIEPESPLRLFRRRMGSLVLYEITPHEQSRVLELFRRADRSNDESAPVTIEEVKP